MITGLYMQCRNFQNNNDKAVFDRKQQCVYPADGKGTLFKTSSSPSLHMYVLVKDELFFPVLLNLFLLMMDELSRDTDNLISFSRWDR